jgi:hypothetical protein
MLGSKNDLGIQPMDREARQIEPQTTTNQIANHFWKEELSWKTQKANPRTMPSPAISPGAIL